MIKCEDQINTRQLMAMSVVSVMSYIMHRLPEDAVSEGKEPASWLSPILAFIPIIIIAWCVNRLLKNRREGQGLTDVIINILGSKLGRIVCLVYAAWCIFFAGITLRTGAERLMSTIYNSENITVFILISIIVAGIGASGKLRALASSAEIFVLFLGVFCLIVFGFSFSNVRWQNLVPITYLDTVTVARASVPVIYSVSPFVLLFFLTGGMKKEEKSLSIIIHWLAAVFIAVMLLLVTTIGTFGATLTSQLESAFFSMARNISIFETIERIESIVIFIWVAADFVMIACLIMIACEIMGIVFGVHSRKKLVWPSAAVTAVIAFICAANAFDLNQLTSVTIPRGTLILIMGVIPTILFIGKVRRRI